MGEGALHFGFSSAPLAHVDSPSLADINLRAELAPKGAGQR